MALNITSILTRTDKIIKGTLWSGFAIGLVCTIAGIFPGPHSFLMLNVGINLLNWAIKAAAIYKISKITFNIYKAGYRKIKSAYQITKKNYGKIKTASKSIMHDIKQALAVAKSKIQNLSRPRRTIAITKPDSRRDGVIEQPASVHPPLRGTAPHAPNQIKTAVESRTPSRQSHSARQHP